MYVKQSQTCRSTLRVATYRTSSCVPRKTRSISSRRRIVKSCTKHVMRVQQRSTSSMRPWSYKLLWNSSTIRRIHVSTQKSYYRSSRSQTSVCYSWLTLLIARSARRQESHWHRSRRTTRSVQRTTSSMRCSSSWARASTRTSVTWSRSGRRRTTRSSSRRHRRRT